MIYVKDWYDLRTKILEISNTPRDDLKDDLIKDIKYTLSLDVEQLQDELDGFGITRKESWDIPLLDKLNFKLNPLDISILKKILEHTDYLVQSQLEGDMEIDNIEERNLYIQLKNLITEETFENAVKRLKFKNSIEFFRSLEDLKTVERTKELKRLVLISYIEHIYMIGVGPMSELSKVLILQSIDRFWMEHLDNMQDLREGISLRNLAQRDPLVEYKNEGFRLFDTMLKTIDENVVNRFFKVRVVRREEALRAPIKTEKEEVKSISDNRPGKIAKQQTIKRDQKKIGRNDPCPCGSGKKYKKCHYPEFG